MPVLLADGLTKTVGAGRARRAAQLIDELGPQPVADHRPHRLSGGEQQRFALARALVTGPELVLADDPRQPRRWQRRRRAGLLRGLHDRAVVIVTHEPRASAIADRVLRLTDGRLDAEPAVRSELR